MEKQESRSHFPKVVELETADPGFGSRQLSTSDYTLIAPNNHLSSALPSFARKTCDCNYSWFYGGSSLLRMLVASWCDPSQPGPPCLDLCPLLFFFFQCSVLPNRTPGSSLAAEVTEQEPFHRRDCMTPRNLRRVFKRVELNLD